MKPANPVLVRLVAERDQINENVDQILAAVESEERDPSEAERDLLARHRARADQLEPQIVQLVELEEQRRDARDARAVLGRVRHETPDDGGNGDDDGDEPDTPPQGEYRTFAQYARDEMLRRFHVLEPFVPPGARQRAIQRLERAVPQVLTADVPGLLPPQYISQIMQVIDKSRPLVDASMKINLTSGKIQYPRITERPTVAEQTAEKTEAGDGSMTVTMQEVLAKTYLAAANFSWQTIQWSSPDALALWFDLAAASYAKQTDAAAGAKLAAADSTPTAVDDTGGALGGWMSAVAGAAGSIYSATGRYADTIAASPDAGFPLLGMVAADSPVFLSTGTANLSTGQYPQIAGLRFVISAGLPANTVIVGDFDALICAENAGAPVELRAVEPSIGGMEVGIIGAFTCEIADPGAFVELTPPA